ASLAWRGVLVHGGGRGGVWGRPGGRGRNWWARAVSAVFGGGSARHLGRIVRRLSPDGARWRLALCRARRRRQGGEARGQRRAGGDQDAAPTEMGEHPRLAAAVLGLPTSSRQRAAR